MTLGFTQGIDGTWQQVNEMQFDVKQYDPRSERILNPPFDAKTGKQLAPPENPALLQGSISFNHEGRLQQFSVADCDLAHSKQNETIQELVESHREWSEAQASAALRKAGARYTPPQKLARRRFKGWLV